MSDEQHWPGAWLQTDDPQGALTAYAVTIDYGAADVHLLMYEMNARAMHLCGHVATWPSGPGLSIIKLRLLDESVDASHATALGALWKSYIKETNRQLP